jgi:hypothetical protein
MATKRVKSIELLEPILIETFGLQRLFKSTPLLNEWLSASGELNPVDKAFIMESQEKLIENADSWNEEELKMSFISMVIFLARFKNPIRTYYDREISAVINEINMSCKADMMLSKGIGEMIKTPYFFLHEYKREKKYSGDPVGQMLGGMLISQAKNNNEKPIYGCYVQGRYWFFATLENSKYVVSKGFDSTEIDEVQQVIFILRKLNEIILKRLME